MNSGVLFLPLIIVVVVVLLVLKSKKENQSLQSKQISSTNNMANSIQYCPYCGAEVNENAIVCVKCGCAVRKSYIGEDVASTGLKVLSFLLPIVGLILYIIYHEQQPNKAREVGKWALISFIINIIILFIMMI